MQNRPPEILEIEDYSPPSHPKTTISQSYDLENTQGLIRLSMWGLLTLATYIEGSTSNYLASVGLISEIVCQVNRLGNDKPRQMFMHVIHQAEAFSGYAKNNLFKRENNALADDESVTSTSEIRLSPSLSKKSE